MSEAGDQEGTERLHQRLRRLGGRRKPTPIEAPSPADSKNSVPLGKSVQTSAGTAYIIEVEYNADHMHGQANLLESFEFEAVLAADVARDDSLGAVDPSELLFVDTETTGLAGGAGTVVFLVGIGQFKQGRFLLRQFFLRDPAQERAMLEALQANLDEGRAFVTFNGRNFDIPLLDMRFQMGMRTSAGLVSWPHLDLLYPARRLWRRSFSDCRLGTLEKEVLGVERTEQDVPGALIPGMYVDYLRTGDATEMERVVYHNALDILSLVSLTGEILKRHRPDGLAGLSGSEALGVARWQEERGRPTTAEKSFRAALLAEELQARIGALRHFSAYLKRENRRAEAVPLWTEWHELAQEDPTPCIELAKFYEWHEPDIKQACKSTEAALVCLSHWHASWRRDQVWNAIEHRLRRLKRKLDPL